MAKAKVDKVDGWRESYKLKLKPLQERYKDLLSQEEYVAIKEERFSADSLLRIFGLEIDPKEAMIALNTNIEIFKEFNLANIAPWTISGIAGKIFVEYNFNKRNPHERLENIRKFKDLIIQAFKAAGVEQHKFKQVVTNAFKASADTNTNKNKNIEDALRSIIKNGKVSRSELQLTTRKRANTSVNNELEESAGADKTRPRAFSEQYPSLPLPCKLPPMLSTAPLKVSVPDIPVQLNNVLPAHPAMSFPVSGPAFFMPLPSPAQSFPQQPGPFQAMFGTNVKLPSEQPVIGAFTNQVLSQEKANPQKPDFNFLG